METWLDWAHIAITQAFHHTSSPGGTHGAIVMEEKTRFFFGHMTSQNSKPQPTRSVQGQILFSILDIGADSRSWFLGTDGWAPFYREGLNLVSLWWTKNWPCLHTDTSKRTLWDQKPWVFHVKKWCQRLGLLWQELFLDKSTISHLWGALCLHLGLWGLSVQNKEYCFTLSLHNRSITSKHCDVKYRREEDDEWNRDVVRLINILFHSQLHWNSLIFFTLLDHF